MLSMVLTVPVLADFVPLLLNRVLTNGKACLLGLLACYLLVLVLWVPLWLVSYLLTEAGVYGLLTVIVVGLGRFAVRLIVFPGASPRVTNEMGVEFRRYSVRLLQATANVAADLASAHLATTAASGSSSESRQSSVGVSDGKRQSDVLSLQAKMSMYTDRVLKVYSDVLGQLLMAASGSHARQSVFSGDIGDLACVTEQGLADGETLLNLIDALLHHLHRLSSNADGDKSETSLSQAAQRVRRTAFELRDFLSSLAPPGSASSHSSQSNTDSDSEVEEEAAEAEASPSSSFRQTLKASAASVWPMLDPAPHDSVFNLDMLRGCLLARYHNANQIWIPRHNRGRIDALHIPPKHHKATDGHKKALLYCNPNAGLYELATGMALTGGNMFNHSSQQQHQFNNWTDFYLQQGYHVFLFNYAGFGRSHGSEPCIPSPKHHNRATPARIARILISATTHFKPSPDSLKADALTVAQHILTHFQPSQLVIHGESIGGMAAAHTANQLTNTPAANSSTSPVSLLVCDRTFANLIATSQRLVAPWTKQAITLVTPLWNTNIARDYLQTTCPKIVANDANDNIIHDAASLRAGIAFAKELQIHPKSTHTLGHILNPPTPYRMADYQNVSLHHSQYAIKPTIQPPLWPADKHINIKEAFHFAAAVRRIGKIATNALHQARTQTQRLQHDHHDDAAEEHIELTANVQSNSTDTPTITTSSNQKPHNTPIIDAWTALAACDGLCGSTLGSAAKDGFDSTLYWLCSLVTYGCQTVAIRAQQRGQLSDDKTILPVDFESHPNRDANPSKPIPKVINTLKQLLPKSTSTAMEEQHQLRDIEQELNYAIGMLEYVVDRLTAKYVVEASLKSIHFRDAKEVNSIGCFLNLQCGHNNPFLDHEKDFLRVLFSRIGQADVDGDGV